MLLAVMEARDKASAIVEKVDLAYKKFGATVDKAAAQAKVAGEAIDSSLLKTASGADALSLADGRVTAAQAKLAAAEREQAAAERALIEANQAAAASANGDVAAMDRQILAASRLEKAEAETAVATKGLSEAQTTQARVATASAAKTDEAALATKRAGAASKEAGTGMMGMSSGMSSVVKGSAMVALGATAVTGAATKMAGDFQDATTHLVTDAGETQAKLGEVQSGMLRIGASTGTSAKAISDAMYHIESAGYHAGEGLKLLETAAQGAKVGNADFGVVAKTLTGTMNAYNMTGDQSVSMMNQLIATVGAGDMKMNDLASSLGNVAPLAAAAGIKFSEVGGAIATMTAQNMSAQQATQDLAFAIRGLQAPNGEAIKEMQRMGLDANDVAQNLGKRGLTGTLEMLTEAVAKHTEGGQVLIDTFKSSKDASADANKMIAAMPPNLQKLAKGFLDGSINSHAWAKDLKELPPIQAHLMSQFAGVADKTHSFNDLLAKGGPQAQTYNQALEKMMGGATGLNTALMLTGGRMDTFKESVNKVEDAAQKGGTEVDNWKLIQGTFNQKMAEAKATVESTAIALGLALLPGVTANMQAVLRFLKPLMEWVTHHQQLAATIVQVVGGIAGFTAVILVLHSAFSKVLQASKLFGQAMGLIKIQSAEAAAASEGSAARVSAGWLTSGVKTLAVATGNFAKWLAVMVAHFAAVAARAVAEAAAVSATWLASSATMVAEAIAKGAVWLAVNIGQFAAVAASAVVSAAITAGAWIAANIVMIAATGGILLAIGLLVAGALWLKDHWREVWDSIKGFSIDAWHWIERYLIHPLVDGFSWVGRELDAFGRWWNDFWDWVGSGLQWVYDHTIGPVVHAISSAISGIKNAAGSIGSAFGGAAHALGFAEGGPVPGTPGRAMLAVVHGGEYVLSRDMLAGRAAPTGLSDLMSAGGTGGGGGLRAGSTARSGGVQINIIVQGNQVLGDSAAQQLADKIGRVLATTILPGAGVRVAM